MKKGQLIAICPQCRKVVNFSLTGYSSRPLPTYDHAEDIGNECPYCQYFKHSHFLNAGLRAMHYDDAPREYRRDYQKKFLKYQKVMLKRYYPSSKLRQPSDTTPGQSHQSQKDERSANQART